MTPEELAEGRRLLTAYDAELEDSRWAHAYAEWTAWLDDHADELLTIAEAHVRNQGTVVAVLQEASPAMTTLTERAR